MASNAPLVTFRILFGLLMLVESWGALATGWVHSAFVEPVRTYPILGFEWIRFLSGEVMYGYFGLMGLAALGAMLGWRYRLCALALAVLWTGAYLGQKTHYNNHYYLAVWITWGMALLPAADRASLDVRAGRRAETRYAHPWIARAFRLQVLIVFTYAAVAKIYPGWLNGDYLKVNLGSKGDRWPLGGLVVQEWFQSATIWGALIFDAVVIPLLWMRRTRVLGFLGLVGFDLFNSIVFRIGIFPYMVIALTVFFFSEPAVERFFRWIPGTKGGGLGKPAREKAPLAPWARATLVLYFAFQVLMPIRHHLYPGDVTWTEEGHRMSWRMMLRTKGGALALVVQDPLTGQSTSVKLRDYLTPRQLGRTATQPDFLFQLVQDLKEEYAAKGQPNIKIFARYSAVSLNGTDAAPLYDPEFDLATATWDHFGRDPWVLDRNPTRRP